MLVIGGALRRDHPRPARRRPNNTLVSLAQFNELFTMHGSLMIYLFAGPFAFGGLANFIVPIQIGAPDMAFPRLNALSYWLYLTGSITMLLGFFTAGGAGQLRLGRPTRRCRTRSTRPAPGADLWIARAPAHGVLGDLHRASTSARPIFYLRAPGMTMFRMPIFTWNMLVDGDPHPARLPGAHRRAHHALLRPTLRHAHLLGLRRRGARCSGSTSSGSGATPRCTSSPCRSSAWPPRSSPCSRASPSSATRAMIFATITIARAVAWACGRTTCSRPASCSCRSSRS